MPIRSLAYGLAVVTLLASATAWAQDGPTAAVLRPVPGPETEAALVGAVERVLRSKLDELAPIRVTGTPNLELRDLQLAVGCMGEDDDCLRSIAEQLEVDGVVITHVDRTGDTIIATIVHYEVESGERNQGIAQAETESGLLEQIDPAVREIYGLPAAERPVGEYESETGGGEETRTVVVRPDDSGLSLVPIIIGGVGVLAIGGGVYLGLRARKYERDFADAPATNAAEVDDALDIKEKGETRALWANLAFAGGGALVALGATLFVIDLASGGSGESEVVAAPTLWEGGGGLAVRGTFGGISW